MSAVDNKVDDYQLVASIASGNSSQVWEVRDGAGQSYAMKLLLPYALKTAEHVAVLKHEAKVAQAVEHPNLVRTLKFVKTKTHCYTLMELFKCPSLKHAINNDLIEVQSRFDRLAEQLCTALGYMHGKGWLHHDLKPNNVLFNSAGDLKIIDFSLSMKRQGGLGKMIVGKVKNVQGTRTYIAPETIQKRYPTPQSEIYSLGITLFEVLTGQPPFTGSNPNDLLKKHLTAKPAEPSALNPNVTPEADKVVLRMLSKKPAQRPKDMSEVAAELRSIQIFKRSPAELAEEKLKEADTGLDSKSRLDSRADAARVAAGIAAPAKPQARKPTAAALADAERHAARKAGSQPQPAPAAQPFGQPMPYGQPMMDPAAAWAAYAQQQAAWNYAYAQPGQPGTPPFAAGPPNAVPAAANWPADPNAAQGSWPQSHQHPQESGASVSHPPYSPASVAPRPPAAAPTASPSPRPAPTSAPIPAQQRDRGGPERHPTQNDAADDLPLMDELPDVF